jgi:pyrroline-5-carboxylate reductase
MKILLIGAGNMGGAILAGMDRSDVTVVEAYAQRAEELRALYPEIHVVESIPLLDGYVVILAVKPQSLSGIDFEGRARALISILAGTSLETLREKIEADAYIRAMPNLAALHQKAITSVTGDEVFREEALAILAGIGQAVWLESEAHLDIATGLGGSAPAWLALIAEALVAGAVEMGLPEETAQGYLPMLFEGTGALLSDESPATLRQRVSSPGGTTVAGLKALDQGGAYDAFVEAMHACYRRAQELS